MALLFAAFYGTLAQPAFVRMMDRSARKSLCQVHPEPGVPSQSIGSGTSCDEWSSTKRQQLVRFCATNIRHLKQQEC